MGSMIPGRFWSGIPGLSSINLGGLTLDTNARFGYEITGLSLDVPNLDPRYVAHLNLSLDSGAYVGRVGVNLRNSSGLDVFVNLTGSTLDKVTVYNEGVDQWRNLGVRGSRIWNGTGVEYWEADGGVGVPILPGVAAVAGVKLDQHNVHLDIADWN